MMVTSAALAVYLIELLKQLFALVTKNPSFEFSPKVMAALLVIGNAVAVLILAVLGQEGYDLPTDWVAWTKLLLLAILGALVSSGLYTFGLKPFKAFVESYKLRKQAKSRKNK
jgi:drug/metabolite transporter (DMT)-like permease